MVNSFRKVIDVVPQNHGDQVKSLAATNDQLKNSQYASASIDYCCNRVFHTVLFNQVKEYTLDSFIGLIFPADTSTEEVKSALEKDNRFELEEVESGIIRVKVSKIAAVNNEKLLRHVEEWKDEMSKYFRKHNCDVKLCMLPQLIKRPQGVPKDVKLVDILNSDPQRRFLLINTSTHSNKKLNEDTMVKYKHTPDEVEHFHKEWRNLLVEYLLKEPHPIPLVTLGTQVAKPKNLGKNQKLIDVVKADPSRFRIIPDLSHNSLTRICLTDDYCKILWRHQICEFFSNRRPSCDQEILHCVPRPLPLSKSVMPSDLFPQRFWEMPSQRHVMHEQPKRQFVNRHQNQHIQRLPPTPTVIPLAFRDPSLGPPPGFSAPVSRPIVHNGLNSNNYARVSLKKSSVSNLDKMNFQNAISEMCPPMVLRRQISEETQTVLSVVDFLYDE